MSGKPEIPYGYLGAQPKFADLGLSLSSHCDPEIDLDSNSLEIKLNFDEKKRLKVTHQLINCSSNQDESKYVFTQTVGNTISFLIGLPCADYFKFQIFALKADDESKSLPNVFNYLIHCKNAPHPCFDYPKQYAQWKDGCNLTSPLCLHKGMNFQNVVFNVSIPEAKGVAVVAEGKWFHLDKKGNHFEKNFDLSPYKGKDGSITLNACLGDDETKYSTMLEYKVNN